MTIRGNIYIHTYISFTSNVVEGNKKTIIQNKMSKFLESRECMYRRIDLERKCFSDEFVEGINIFLCFAHNQISI